MRIFHNSKLDSRKKEIVLAAILILFFGIPLFAEEPGIRSSDVFFNRPPSPRLIQPTKEEVNLSGKDYLRFKWQRDIRKIRSYIFKIYKGYDMYASNLVYKEELSDTENSIEVKSSLFEDGQVYTWSLIQVALNGLKSDKGFYSFKVKK